ncbi:DUF2800 domain-containing protein [Leisingera sp. NJS204]|uniref:DUF2800 domain-containing protein n=1 Tax=Leisingera sp. NJS204 TaxID=2508307 RepID=UPI00101390D5|nr:DUF2800 domain-containing protein [Leisingera sp. NJS204]QAX31294.1 DUF2800 domain-containing protein [Leisingera sp. NJS204]
MTAHAKLGPSGAHRWMLCPASVEMEAQIPDTGIDSPYAVEGTTAHALAEMALANNRDADDYAGVRFNPDLIHVDDDMVEYVQMYLDYVRELGGTRFTEQRVDISRWVPESFGTADNIVFTDDGVMHVIDLKYGKGVPVFAQNNPQGMCYALGALAAYDFLFDIETVRIVIHQPRLDVVSEWDISREDLLAWADNELAPAAQAANAEDAPFNPGDKQCRFCDAKGICRALAEHNLAVACEGFSVVGDPISTKDVKSLAPEEIAGLLPQLDLLTKWAKSVEGHAQGLLELGEDVPGFKLVEGRSVRKWADEDAAGKALSRKLGAKNAFTKKLITITQAEKELGRGDPLIVKHTVKPEGKPTIAPVSDKRRTIEIDVTDGFGEVPDAA